MGWTPPSDWPAITTVESHAGGEPLRVVVDGFPTLEGETMLAKRQYAREHHDDLRRGLMWEPRGHADMYGAILTPSTSDDGDIGVIFTHNDGYSTMCGHGIIALGVVLPELGVVPDREQLTIDTPAGPVNTRQESPHAVSFENVPSFAVDRGATVEVPDYGVVQYDLAFGGAFYAYCEASQVGVSLDRTDTDELRRAGREIKRAIAADRTISHPTDPDLGYLYGTILTGPARGEADLRNVCVFADGEVDRSPTGTGVSGHLALRSSAGEMEAGDRLVVESIVDSTFVGRVVDHTSVGPCEAVVPEVTGRAHITGSSTFTIDPEDPLGDGFLLR